MGVAYLNGTECLIGYQGNTAFDLPRSESHSVTIANDSWFLVPHDMKKPTQSVSLAWVVEKETSSLPYGFYLTEFSEVFKEASHVQIRK